MEYFIILHYTMHIPKYLCIMIHAICGIYYNTTLYYTYSQVFMYHNTCNMRNILLYYIILYVFSCIYVSWYIDTYSHVFMYHDTCNMLNILHFCIILHILLQYWIVQSDVLCQFNSWNDFMHRENSFSVFFLLVKWSYKLEYVNNFSVWFGTKLSIVRDKNSKRKYIENTKVQRMEPLNLNLWVK